MASLKDVLKFEGFNLKDILSQLMDDPARVLLGALDPASTGLWNKVLGKDWEPVVDQLGGPYGGSAFSAFGERDGGVYQRAQEAGINTEPGGKLHDIAHIVASIYGGKGLAQAGRGAFQSFQAGRATPAAGGSGASAGSSNPVQQGFDLSNIPSFGGGGGGGGGNANSQLQLQQLLERLRLQRQQELLRQQALSKRNALIMQDNPLFRALG